MADEKALFKDEGTKQEGGKQKFVVHNLAPGFSVRSISRQAWSTIGIDHGDVEWNEDNRFRIPASEFSDEALKYFASDDGFDIVEE